MSFEEEHLTSPHPAPMRKAIKRTLDVLAALVLLLILSPLLVVIGLTIRATSPGPAIFKQVRVGQHFRTFTLWKFRTMEQCAPVLREGEVLDPANPQITSVGRILRQTSLDELPQLINVLRGEMSLVGPRPLVEWEARMCLARHALRFTVLPGLTGLQQIEVRNSVDLFGRSDCDVAYVRSWGLLQDLLILLRTPACLIRGEGVYEKSAGQPTRNEPQ